MPRITRTERNKELHIKVNQEIAYRKKNHDEKSLVNSTFEKLKAIDQAYFWEKIQAFDKKHQIEKPYLDKDRSSSILSDELKYEIKSQINELKKIKQKSVSVQELKIDEKSLEEEEYIYNSEKFKRYNENLLRNEKLFSKNIEKLKSKQVGKIDVAQDIEMTTVQSIRSQDNRAPFIMVKEVNDKVMKTSNVVQSSWKSFIKKRRFKWALSILIMLILIMLVAILLPIFI
ncbi:hypothetical protein [Spiroplasma culicicola]|uniref:Transmembrane protein n=1 Tax=Spiroplasma culicicola AES-1 TaxID=1276246 RepID=W6AG25_9MOLU|nr:hypothetical protein [Spiroplasma culicicola]AHI52659.1 hypothetical protein SCULI_v1c03180 [Spiroplasma culicicola AES-1]